MLETQSPTTLEGVEFALARLDERQRRAIAEYNSGERSLDQLQSEIAAIRQLRAELNLPLD